MKVLTQQATPERYELYCDATDYVLQECALTNDEMLGSTVVLNSNYGGMIDGEPTVLHFSERVTRDFLNYLAEKYDSSELKDLLRKL